MSTLYNFYNNLTYFGGYTLNDIDNMYPFEREILQGLLKKTLKELKEGNNGK